GSSTEPDHASTTTSWSASRPSGRVMGTIAPVEVSLCAHATTSASVFDKSAGDGAVPAGPSTISGSSSHGACLDALANLDENSPKLKCADFLLMRPKVAASQKAVAPPRERTIS